MLCGIALLHGLYLQRGLNAAGQRMNIGLAITGFIAVMYASYLTRSGVLTQFSNHSFSELPHAWFLVSGLLFFLLLGYGFYLIRYRTIPAPRMFESLSSREFGFYLSVVMLMIAAALVTFGISTPIITGWLQAKPSTVAPDFYNWTMAPVGFLLAALLAVYPVTTRNGIAGKELRGRLAVPVVLGIVAVLVTEYGARKAGGLTAVHLFAAASLAFGGTVALSLNAIQLGRLMKTGAWSAFGGYLAHVGFGILLLGIVASSIYSETRRINVPMNGTANALGYRFTLPNRGDSPDDKKTVIPLGVTAVGRLARLGRLMFPVHPFMTRDRNGMQMTAPGIYSHPLYDLYVAPVEFDPGSYESMPIQLKPGQVYSFGPLKLYYSGLTALGDHMNPEGIRAEMLAVRGKVHVPIGPQLDFHTERATIIDLPGGSRVNIDPGTKFDSEGSLTFDLSGPNARLTDAYAIVDVTIKPFIWLTWLGMITTVVGGLISALRRARDNRGVAAGRPAA
jgi:cytochrome c-type biogenesis protein CcmF